MTVMRTGTWLGFIYLIHRANLQMCNVGISADPKSPPRFQCLECGRERSTLVGMRWHFKGSGHSGYRNVTPSDNVQEVN